MISENFGMHIRKPPNNQRGAVLIVSLLLLLVMTALALTASQTTRMQERMAGNLRDMDMSFQAGEAGLRTAEQRIDTALRPKANAIDVCSDPDACDADDRENVIDNSEGSIEWWAANAHEFEETLDGIETPPVYVTSLWADVSDTLTVGAATPKSGTMYYSSTARSVGRTAAAVTIVETTYAIRY